MGNIRRIVKKQGNGISLAKTGLVYGGSVVCLISDDVSKAKSFGGECIRNAGRSSCFNVYDVLEVSSLMRKRMLNGEPIWN